jgi:hypothetical protein
VRIDFRGRPPLALQIQTSLPFSLFTRDARAAHPALLAAREISSQLRRSRLDGNCGRCAKSVSVPLPRLGRLLPVSAVRKCVAKKAAGVEPRLQPRWQSGPKRYDFQVGETPARNTHCVESTSCHLDQSHRPFWKVDNFGSYTRKAQSAARTEANVPNLRVLLLRATEIPRCRPFDAAIPFVAFFDQVRSRSDTR